MRTAVLIALVAVTANAASYQHSAREIVAPYVQTNNFSGVILAARGSEVLLRGAYGLADVEQHVAVASDTRFYIGSLSKMFTAAAILQLRDARKLTLDDTLSRFLPDFPRGDRITVLQLLKHRSGLPQDSASPGYFERASRSFTLDEAVDLLRDATPSAEPGARRIYSNSNYVLLARVVERASGETFSEYLQRHLFAPLRMADTGLHKSWLDIVPRRARGYSPVERTGLYNAAHYDYSIGTGAGSAWSTAGDLQRWMRGLFKGVVLQRASVDEMFGSEPFVGTSIQSAGHAAIELTGWDGVGFASALIYVPHDDVITIVLTNRNVPSVASDVAEALRRLVYGEETARLEFDERELAADELQSFCGTYRLGNDFYVPGTTLEIVRCARGLCERQRDGRLVALLRTRSGDFVHRSSWGRIAFHENRLTFYGRFEAVRIR